MLRACVHPNAEVNTREGCARRDRKTNCNVKAAGVRYLKYLTPVCFFSAQLPWHVNREYIAHTLGKDSVKCPLAIPLLTPANL
jgi:hypothetical protein